MIVVPNPTRSKQRGVAAVEFAIALPLILFLMLATTEFGRVLAQYDTLTKTVRNGCRYVASQASVAGGTTGVVNVTSQVQTDASKLVVYGNTAGTGSALLPGFATSNVTVSDAGNGYVSVSATYAYSPMMGSTLPSFGLGTPISLNFSLTSAVTMKAL